MRLRGPMRHLVLCGLALAAASAQALNNDPPGRFLPGAYLEYEAQFYLRKGDYAEALRLFELAGYWANKVAQYNVGIMYFNGIGDTPADKALGTAWLGIAAEQHGEMADAALRAAWDELTPEQRREADRLFRNLDQKYGDRVAFRCARLHYEAERSHVTGSRVGLTGNMVVIDARNPLRFGTEYFKEQDQTFDEYIARLGQVGVGEVRPLPLPPEARAKASRKPLQRAGDEPSNPE